MNVTTKRDEVVGVNNVAQWLSGQTASQGSGEGSGEGSGKGEYSGEGSGEGDGKIGGGMQSVFHSMCPTPIPSPNPMGKIQHNRGRMHGTTFNFTRGAATGVGVSHLKQSFPDLLMQVDSSSATAGRVVRGGARSDSVSKPRVLERIFISSPKKTWALEKKKKMKIICCSVHGYTQWESSLIALINTPEFQRLKRIKQLAAVHHVFPCATHTRFEHSIGVGHLAEKFVLALLARQPELDIDPLTFKLAGLCHDLGHGPLSHAFDRYLHDCGNTQPEHETRSVAILRDVVRRYAIPLDAAIVDAACELIHPMRHDLPKYQYQIIANHVDGIDVDKFDYLRRDALHTGVRVALDVERFFEYARIVDGCISYPPKMQHTINQLFTVRHELHSLVYQHRVVRAVEHMYLDVLKMLNVDDLPLQDLTDHVFTQLFVEWSVSMGRVNRATANSVIQLLHRIETRDFYECIIDERVTPERLPPLGFANMWHALILDVVKIGYSSHPIFAVAFDDAPRLSNICSTKPFDCFVRLYSRMSRMSRIRDKGSRADRPCRADGGEPRAVRTR